MQSNAFSKQLATIVGLFGICANVAGTFVSLISGLSHVSGSENYIADTLVCLFCALTFSAFFIFVCLKKKDYNRFNAIAVNYCGFITFPAMYIATGNLICGFPFYMLIIPVYYGFSLPLKKRMYIMPAVNLIFFDTLLLLTFLSPVFPGRRIIPNMKIFQTVGSFSINYIFLFCICYLVSSQFAKQNETLEESEKRYKELSSLDELTGLSNRRALDDRAELGFNNAIIYDIDHFKNINDTYGHQVGDEALKNLSQIVLKYCSNEFELFRFGGEEFVILSRLPDDVTLELFQHVMHDVRMNFVVKGNPVTISAGIASFCKDYNRTLKIADENLYLAKTDGRNKIYMNGEEIRY